MWPLVALFGIAVSAVTAILIFSSPEDAQARSMVLTILSIISPLFAVEFIRRILAPRIDDVKKEVEKVKQQVSTTSDEDDEISS